eukprot:TRINITY_DN25083_c0_g1_i1.p1 TRINITY_DN25083_c0_g1~~TRINITY_DN25083_c0_g1_i1.p1  ORF type:complete len:767 (+),score=324.22 TRINITY_DN25083_c0_g1_i1:449-2749(+)
MEAILSHHLRIKEWPIFVSGPAAMGAAFLVARTFCWRRGDHRTERDAHGLQNGATTSPRKRSLSVVHSNGIDVDSLYRLWCGGDRSIEKALCNRIDMELLEGTSKKDVIHVNYLLGIAQHLPAFDKQTVHDYEVIVRGWRRDRWHSIFALLRYAQPRPEVITMVALLHAARPLIWESSKATEELLNDAAKAADLTPFCRHALRYVVTSLLDAGISYAIGYLKKQGEARFTNTVKVEIISHILKLDLQYFDTHKTHLTEFTEDIEKLRYLVTDRLFQMLHFTTIAFHSVRLSMQSQGQAAVTLSCLLAAPILFVAKEKLQQLQDLIDSSVTGQVIARKGATREPEHTVAGLLNRLMVVRCNAAEDFESLRVMEEEVACLTDTMQTQTVGELSLSSLRGTIVPGLFVLYLVRVGQVVSQRGLLHTANIPYTAEIAIEAFDHMNSLWEEVTEFTDSDFTVRLTSLLNTKPSIDTGLGACLGPAEESGVLQIDNVEFTYPGTKRQVLRNVSFRLEYGKKLAIVGRSGCGKSTLASLLIRLYDPDKGSIHFSGEDVRDLNVRWLRRRIATVQQAVTLPPGTVFNAFTYGLENITLDDVMKVSKVVGLHKVIQSLKHGYDTRIGGSGGASFSGGQTQRIAISRALLSRPKVLLLDEATNMLDPWTERIVLRNVMEYLEGASLVMISHRASTTLACDLVLCLKKGAVEECGTFQDLLDRNGETAMLFREEQSDEDALPTAFAPAHLHVGSRLTDTPSPIPPLSPTPPPQGTVG